MKKSQAILVSADLRRIYARVVHDNSHAAEAQVEERRTRNAEVTGSTPVSSSRLTDGYLST
jgi:hypothetical protein